MERAGLPQPSADTQATHNGSVQADGPHTATSTQHNPTAAAKFAVPSSTLPYPDRVAAGLSEGAMEGQAAKSALNGDTMPPPPDPTPAPATPAPEPTKETGEDSGTEVEGDSATESDSSGGMQRAHIPVVVRRLDRGSVSQQPARGRSLRQRKAEARGSQGAVATDTPKGSGTEGEGGSSTGSHSSGEDEEFSPRQKKRNRSRPSTASRHSQSAKALAQNSDTPSQQSTTDKKRAPRKRNRGGSSWDVSKLPRIDPETEGDRVKVAHAGRVRLVDLLLVGLLKAGERLSYMHHGVTVYATLLDDGAIKAADGAVYPTPSGWAKIHANHGNSRGSLQISGWDCCKARGEPLTHYRQQFEALRQDGHVWVGSNTIQRMGLDLTLPIYEQLEMQHRKRMREGRQSLKHMADQKPMLARQHSAASDQRDLEGGRKRQRTDSTRSARPAKSRRDSTMSCASAQTSYIASDPDDDIPLLKRRPKAPASESEAEGGSRGLSPGQRRRRAQGARKEGLDRLCVPRVLPPPMPDGTVHDGMYAVYTGPAVDVLAMCWECGGHGHDQPMVLCCLCGETYHTRCQGLEAKDLGKARRGLWRCMKCLVCEMCCRSAPDHLLFLCDRCDGGYHPGCLGLEGIPEGSVWVCPTCTAAPPATEPTATQQPRPDSLRPYHIPAPEPASEAPAGSLQAAPPVAEVSAAVGDSRPCCLCPTTGDRPIEEQGALLCVGVGVWAHSHCAMWCRGVKHDGLDGSNPPSTTVRDVLAAAHAAQKTVCKQCQATGASIVCGADHCSTAYHLPCAMQANCQFAPPRRPDQSMRRMFCPAHPTPARGSAPVCAPGPVLIPPPLPEAVTDRDQVHVRHGSLLVTALGTVDESGYPIGYRAVRTYWTHVPGGMPCHYELGIEEGPVFCIRGPGLRVRDWDIDEAWKGLREHVHGSRPPAVRLPSVFATCGRDLFGLTLALLQPPQPPRDREATKVSAPASQPPLQHVKTEPALPETEAKGQAAGADQMSARTDSNPLPALHTRGQFGDPECWLQEPPPLVSEAQIQLRAAQYRQLAVSADQQVEVLRSAIHGFGLFAVRTFVADDMVVEWVGEVIRMDLAHTRAQRSRGGGMMRLDSEWAVDATHAGNQARFVNHSCQPNTVRKIFRLDSGDGGRDHIVFFALREIAAGEEITVDYFAECPSQQLPYCDCKGPTCRAPIKLKI